MAFITLARNVRVDTESSTHSAHIALFILRELYLLGYWQEMEKSTDTGWTSASNVLAEPSDLAVAASTPLEITSASTPFTLAMEGQYISLFASDSSNRGLYRIKSVLSTSRIVVEEMCRPDPWVDESGISAKIHNASKSDYLATGAWFVMRAPSATGRPMEVYVEATAADNVSMYGYPLGDWFDPPGTPSTPGSRTVTTGSGGLVAASGGYSYFNAYITDPAGEGLLHHTQIGTPSMWARFVAGELEDVALGDDYPGFVNTSGSNYNYELVDSDYCAAINMLDDTNVGTDFWPTWMANAGLSGFGSDSSPHRNLLTTRMKGKAPFWKPNVAAPNASNGGYIRGTLPYYTCNHYQPLHFPIDPGFFHIRNGIVIPRSSTLDKTLRGPR